MTTPMHLFNGSSRTYQAANALTDTINASIGYAENLKDFGLGLISNGIGNGLGYISHYLPLGRGLGNLGRKFFAQGITQGSNYLTDKAKNKFYNDNK